MSTTTQLHSKPAGQLRRRWRRTPCLSSQQLDRAVFLDFESFRDGPPLFCGMLIDGQFKQVVFEVGLAKAAAEKGLAVCERRPHLLQIVEQAEREDRLIVGFSTKECTDLYEVTGQQLGERYLNALSLSKKWRKKFHPSAHKAVLRRRERLRRRGPARPTVRSLSMLP